MQHLRYHLTVHNPYRPVEGLLIDIKTRMQHIIQVSETAFAAVYIASLINIQFHIHLIDYNTI